MERGRRKPFYFPVEEMTGCGGSTTSVLTATALVYTLGAGITAAAGTRLALQSLLAEGFEFCSFQLQPLIAADIEICRHYLAVLAGSNLRACCLPWKW